MDKKKVVIVGGGFGGIRAALDLAKHSKLDVTLISKGTCFEYYPGLHKLVGVSHHATYAIPLATIFKNKKVTVVTGEVTSVDTATKTVFYTPPSLEAVATPPLEGEDSAPESKLISADYLIIAIGSQTEYFGIPGLQEFAFGFKSVAEAKRLRSHIEDSFKKYIHADKSESVVGLHFVVVGAGPNGVDVAGELAALADYFSARYKITRSLVTIDLIEGGNRVLQAMPEEVSDHVENRLRDLGINVLCNRDLLADDTWTVTLADMKVGARTLVWTAGVTTNELIKKVSGLTLGKRNRAAVDEYLQAKGIENVFIIGDAADTQYCGLAQTALYDAQYVADVIQRKLWSKKLSAYIPHPPAFNIGAGRRWSVMMVGGIVMYGFIPYMLRTIIDIKFFLSILPISEVWNLYFGNKTTK